MPRDSQGLYSLPAGNPVVPGTLIEATWANPTMSDVGQALTDSLPRAGTSPMTGMLTLAIGNPTQPRHATSKAYVDQFMAYATGLPLGSIIAYAAGTAPLGFLLCDGGLASRTTYAALFAIIGTTYGAGDGATTFNLPDLRDYFIRGREPTSRQVGSTQADATKLHNHPVTDTGHSHTITNPTHSHGLVDSGHAHGITDPTHAHTVVAVQATLGADGSGTPRTGGNVTIGTSAAATGIGINSATTGASISASAQATSAASALAGVAVAAFGDAETRPKNIAMDYYIKAIQDSVGPSGQVLGILTSDPNMIDIDGSNPVYPGLVIHSNVAQGIPKLDSNGKIPTALLPAAGQAFLGVYDASTGNNPSQEFPTQTFVNGDTYLVAVAGTILVFSPVTKTSAMTLCNIGTNLVFIDNGLDPVGWYRMEPSAVGVIAANVLFTPAGDISAINVQAAIEEVNAHIDTQAISYAIALG